MADVETFVRVMQAGSVNGAARGLGVGAPQVSTPAQRSELIVAAPSFLWLVLVARLSSVLRRLRVHAVEMSSGAMTAFASQPSFDAAFTVGDVRWPGSWVTKRAGAIRRALFATPARAGQLGARVRGEALRRELFVGRFQTEGGRLVPSPDGCPLPARERRFGHRAETVAMALELARLSDQLVFAPAIAARPFVRRRSLVEIAVEGWNVREPVHVVCHQDRVEASVQRALVAAAGSVLGD